VISFDEQKYFTFSLIQQKKKKYGEISDAVCSDDASE